jgi:hypothetical protein
VSFLFPPPLYFNSWSYNSTWVLLKGQFEA